MAHTHRLTQTHIPRQNPSQCIHIVSANIGKYEHWNAIQAILNRCCSWCWSLSVWLSRDNGAKTSNLKGFPSQIMTKRKHSSRMRIDCRGGRGVGISYPLDTLLPPWYLTPSGYLTASPPKRTMNQGPGGNLGPERYHILPLWTEWQTPVKTLPSRNLVGGQ